MEKLYKIAESDLKRLMDNQATSLVGKVCKRLELFNDVNLAKKSIKELVYESHRDLIALFDSYDSGVRITQFKFVQPEDTP